MKKITILVFVALFAVVLNAGCSTDAQAALDSPKKITKPLIEKYLGKITFITGVNKAQNEIGGFTLNVDGGKTKEFKLIPKTRFFSSASRPIDFKDFKKGDRVTVLSVVTLNGDNDVISMTKN